MNTSRWATKSPVVEPVRSPAQDNEQDAPTAVQDAPAQSEPQSSYEPTYQSQDIPIDEFAQTRPPDDLFDDDFIPYEDSTPAEFAPPAEIQEPTTSHVPESEFVPSAIPTGPRGGRGVPRGPRRGANTSRHASQTPKPTQQPTNEASAAVPPPAEDAETDANANATKPERREAAVRGDRSGTGGPKHKKLSEDELSAKLAEMKLKNASLMEKHARSQADEESFHQREAVAAQKRKEERVNRQQMMGEREKNRLRKLKAQGGREWDLEKDEGTFEDSRRGNRRGAYGGVVGPRQENVPASSESPEETHSFGSRGRGGRGRGRGGRGDHGGRGAQDTRQAATKAPNTSLQQVPSANDFPDLPEGKKIDNKDVEPAKTLDFPIKNKAILDKSVAELVAGGEKTSWADQVEQSA